MACPGPYDAICGGDERSRRGEGGASLKARGLRRPRIFVSVVVIAVFAVTLVAIRQFQSVSTYLSTTILSTNPILTPSSDSVRRESGQNSSGVDLPPRAVQHEGCLIYDKPYRTGSTTISHALRSCWTTLRARMRHDRWSGLRESESGYISRMLRSEFPIVGLVGLHFRISEEEIEELRTYCNLYVYITSTRCMRERLASEAKFHSLESSSVHTNYTLSRRQTRRAQSRVTEHDWSNTELIYEQYPFQEGRAVLKPSYIVRNERLVDDLHALLNAFGCPSHFVSVNVHGTNRSVLNGHSTRQGFESYGDDDTRQQQKGFVDSKQLNVSGISLQFGDARHKRLSVLAQRVNERGLRRARAIASLARRDSKSLT